MKTEKQTENISISFHLYLKSEFEFQFRHTRVKIPFKSQKDGTKTQVYVLISKLDKQRMTKEF